MKLKKYTVNYGRYRYASTLSPIDDYGMEILARSKSEAEQYFDDYCKKINDLAYTKEWKVSDLKPGSLPTIGN